jgi:hypothetical protein
MTDRLLRLHGVTLGHRIDLVSEGRTHTIGAEPGSQGFDGSAEEFTDSEEIKSSAAESVGRLDVAGEDQVNICDQMQASPGLWGWEHSAGGSHELLDNQETHMG